MGGGWFGPSQQQALCHIMLQKVTFGSHLRIGLLQGGSGGFSRYDNLRAFLVLYNCRVLQPE